MWGASRGLGKAAALQLTQEGVEVTLLSRTAQALHEAQENILLQTGVRPNAECCCGRYHYRSRPTSGH